MKLSKETLAILKNFSTINQSILFEEGNVLRTMAPSKAIIAMATITEDIPSTAAIYDLSRFLNVVSAYSEPEVEFSDDYFIVQEGKKRATYTYSDPGMIVAPKKKSVDFPDADVTATVSAETMESVLRMAGVLNLKDIAFVGNGENLIIRAMDAEGATNDKFDIEIGEISEEFRFVISANNFKLVNQDYTVDISRKGISRFTGKNGMVYYVAVNAKQSKYGA